jgi:hypothetical protein
MYYVLHLTIRKDEKEQRCVSSTRLSVIRSILRVVMSNVIHGINEIYAYIVAYLLKGLWRQRNSRC